MFRYKIYIFFYVHLSREGKPIKTIAFSWRICKRNVSFLLLQHPAYLRITISARKVRWKLSVAQRYVINVSMTISQLLQNLSASKIHDKDIYSKNNVSLSLPSYILILHSRK